MEIFVYTARVHIATSQQGGTSVRISQNHHHFQRAFLLRMPLGLKPNSLVVIVSLLDVDVDWVAFGLVVSTMHTVSCKHSFINCSFEANIFKDAGCKLSQFGHRAGDSQSSPYAVLGEWYLQKHLVKATFLFFCIPFESGATLSKSTIPDTPGAPRA